MKVLLLSGGSGKRLWPLSNNQRSKQFIKILRHEDNLESMVQRVWRQLGTLGLQEDAYIATGEGQRSILKHQLGIDDSKIITEPTRRDTFPAIALASTYMHTMVGADLDETIAVLPVDPYVDLSFFKKVLELENLLDEEKASLGLIGIQPSLPSEKYGYIVPESASSRKVKRFQEKPNRQYAKELIDEGAVWNAGVFGFKLSTMLDLLKEMNITTDFNKLQQNYDLLPKDSFDYEFSEKQDNIAFLRYDGFWKDLGTWNTLTEEMDTRAVGYTTQMIDTENTHVINETRLPIAAIGVKDLVIAAGPEGIFVSTKEESPRVKEISEELFESVRYVEENWGVRNTLYESKTALTRLYQILDGKEIFLDLTQNQKLIKLSGKGTIAQTDHAYSVTGIKDFSFVVVTEKI
ncbi:MAG: mannose-1-phosphate guanylyltransferase [Streptococcaceae bacterium]|jgi:mannose-1-phosphate guanylyltransferase|nr:mannose-1-phosphate guanylyltransferase [Streptococcaceae bacterium]